MATSSKTGSKKNKASVRTVSEVPPGREASAATARSWLNLRMIEVFVAVVQRDGMTNAANHLGMTQSAVSQAITAIESGLGTQLIDRSVRPMQLTLFGTTFFERAIELLRRSRELEQLVDMQHNARLPVLRVGMADSFASTAGPQLLSEIATLASRWSVVSGVEETSRKALIEQRVDLIITSEDVGRSADLITLPILREPMFIVAPRSLAVSKGGGESLEALGERLPLVRYSPGTFLGRHVETYLRHHEFDLARQYEFDTSDAVLAMVKAGFGWTITTPLCVLKSQAVLDDFQYLPLKPEAAARTLRVVAHNDEHSAIWERIAATARTALKHHWIPRIKKLAPWAEVSSG
jgi:DNA-binding transcriptional LysR family regulator